MDSKIVKGAAKHTVDKNTSKREEEFDTSMAKDFSETITMENSDVLFNFSNFPRRKKKKQTAYFNSNNELEENDEDQSGGISFYTEQEFYVNTSNSICAEKKSDIGISSKSSDETEMHDIMIDMNFNFPKKKKRSRHLSRIQEELEDIPIRESETQLLDKLSISLDCEYTYEYLLSRFYGIAELERPNVDINSTMKIVLKPPQVHRVGSKKTAFSNLIDICRSLRRTPQHVISFILTELGTTGSVDGNSFLIIKGRFQQNQISNILRRYAAEYVKCATCNSMSTIMQKRIRMYFLICEICNSQRSVANIKSGFQALTSKRATMRAKTST